MRKNGRPSNKSAIKPTHAQNFSQLSSTPHPQNTMTSVGGGLPPNRKISMHISWGWWVEFPRMTRVFGG